MKRLRRMRLVYTTAAFALIRLLFILLMHLDVGFLKDWGNTVLWGRSSRLRPTKGGAVLTSPQRGPGGASVENVLGAFWNRNFMASGATVELILEN